MRKCHPTRTSNVMTAKSARLQTCPVGVRQLIGWLSPILSSATVHFRVAENHTHRRHVDVYQNVRTLEVQASQISQGFKVSGSSGESCQLCGGVSTAVEYYKLFQAIEWYMNMRATRKIFCHLESFSSRDDKQS